MFIAEIGLNHLGNEDLAWKYVRELTRTSVDAITFQIREDSYYDASKPHRIELSDQFYLDVAEFIRIKDKQFGIAIASPCEKINFFHHIVDFWKILSMSAHDIKLVEELQKTNKQVYVSCGLCEPCYAGVKYIYTNLSRDPDDCGLSKLKDKKYSAYGLHTEGPIAIYLSSAYGVKDYFFYVRCNEDEIYPDNQGLLIHTIDKMIDGMNACAKLF